MRSFASVRNRNSEGAVLSALGDLRCRQGRTDEARAFLAMGEALLREGGLRAELVLSLCLRGQVDLVAGDGGAAHAALKEAIDLAREMNVGDASTLAQNVGRLRRALAQFVEQRLDVALDLGKADQGF